MKTITAPNGKQYEVEDGWEDVRTMPLDEITTRLYSDGSIGTGSGYHCYQPIAWRPIVKPKEVRWRAERGGEYFFVQGHGKVEYVNDNHDAWDDGHYSIGNYFRTREEAEASNKARVMRDPESER